MDNSLWVKMHGGTTHFPIALVMASALFDLAGLVVPENAGKSLRAGFRAEMPSFAKKFSDSDVQALTAYLRTLKD